MKTVADCQISSFRKKEKYTERGRERKTEREMGEGKKNYSKNRSRRKKKKDTRKGRDKDAHKEWEREKKRCDEGFKKEIGRKKFREWNKWQDREESDFIKQSLGKRKRYIERKIDESEN